MKKLFTLFLIGALLLSLLSGCSDKQTHNPENPITLTIWHVYGNQTSSPLNDAINEFNNTVGQDLGILINVTMVTDSNTIDDVLTSTLTGEPGSPQLPDLFIAYPRIAEAFEENALLDYSDYFTETELSAYRSDFLSEGYFDDKLLMLPIAKSSELVFVNKTLFDDFSSDTGITTDCFSSLANLMSACTSYFDWSGGDTMFQINDFYYCFLANMAAMDTDFIVDGKINADSDAFEKVFSAIASAGICGGLCLDDGYASNRWKTGEIIALSGSTASMLYLRDYVTYDNNTTKSVETMVLPYTCLTGSNPTVVQRGGGLFTVKSSDERKNEAACIFAKWITQQHNLDFVTSAGYLPVTDTDFEKLLNDTSSIQNEKYRMLYRSVSEQYSKDYRFCSIPIFEGSADTQKEFEALIKSTLSAAHEEYLRQTENGSDKVTVLNDLSASALRQVLDALR